MQRLLAFSRLDRRALLILTSVLILSLTTFAARADAAPHNDDTSGRSSILTRPGQRPHAQGNPQDGGISIQSAYGCTGFWTTVCIGLEGSGLTVNKWYTELSLGGAYRCVYPVYEATDPSGAKTRFTGPTRCANTSYWYSELGRITSWNHNTQLCNYWVILSGPNAGTTAKACKTVYR